METRIQPGTRPSAKTRAFEDGPPSRDLATPPVPSRDASTFVSALTGSQPPAPQDGDVYRRLIDAVRSDASVLPPPPVLGPHDAIPRTRPPKVAMYVAHPDDESGYAGGTLRRLTRAGTDVDVVLMTHGEGGRIVAKTGDGRTELRAPDHFSVEHLVKTRDREVGEAAGRLGVSASHLFSHEHGLDFGYTQSTAQTLRRWDELLPGGLERLLLSLVRDLRARRPDVVMTLMQEDSEALQEHGAHKAAGVLMDVAARLAADPAFGDGTPHVVREFVTVAPQRHPQVAVDVQNEDRRHAMRAYPSQFLEEMIPEVEQAIHGSAVDAEQEQYDIRWRASGSPVPAQGSLFQALLERSGDLTGEGPSWFRSSRQK